MPVPFTSLIRHSAETLDFLPLLGQSTSIMTDSPTARKKRARARPRLPSKRGKGPRPPASKPMPLRKRSAPRTPTADVTAAELLDRVLYRDALVIVPRQAGGHSRARRARRRTQSGSIVRRPATRPAAPAVVGAPSRPGYVRLSGAGTSSQSVAQNRRHVCRRTGAQDLLGHCRGRPEKAPGAHHLCVKENHAGARMEDGGPIRTGRRPQRRTRFAVRWRRPTACGRGLNANRKPAARTRFAFILRRSCVPSSAILSMAARRRWNRERLFTASSSRARDRYAAASVWSAHRRDRAAARTHA